MGSWSLLHLKPERMRSPIHVSTLNALNRSRGSAHLFPRELNKLSRPHLTAPRLEIKRNVKQ